MFQLYLELVEEGKNGTKGLSISGALSFSNTLKKITCKREGKEDKERISSIVSLTWVWIQVLGQNIAFKTLLYISKLERERKYEVSFLNIGVLLI